MALWSRQQYMKEGAARGISVERLEAALSIAHAAQSKGLPPVLTLRHLAEQAGVRYTELSRTIRGSRAGAYRRFQLAKRAGGYRTIHVPSAGLMQVQQWIARNILGEIAPHSAAAAYARGRRIFDTAEQHCEAQWLLKIDIKTFFESITERQVYHVYRGIGYPALVALEMAKISTIVSDDSGKYRLRRWQTGRARYLNSSNSLPYVFGRLGHLPQGAPTSPQLSNLVARSLDERITALLAAWNGWRYSRYSDDLIFSTPNKSSRTKVVALLAAVLKLVENCNFRPNRRKTVIAGPGSRRIVLGLAVDGDRPRLSVGFRNRLNSHMFSIARYGANAHAEHRKFRSVLGLRRHVEGLLAYAMAIDPDYVNWLNGKFVLKWPL